MVWTRTKTINVQRIEWRFFKMMNHINAYSCVTYHVRQWDISYKILIVFEKMLVLIRFWVIRPQSNNNFDFFVSSYFFWIFWATFETDQRHTKFHICLKFVYNCDQMNFTLKNVTWSWIIFFIILFYFLYYLQYWKMNRC